MSTITVAVVKTAIHRYTIRLKAADDFPYAVYKDRTRINAFTTLSAALTCIAHLI